MDPRHSVERAIERLASRQFGAFSRDQATLEGVTRRMFDSRLASGQWELVLPRVYRIVAVPASYRQRAMAATLWSAPDGLVSHESAATLWNLEGIVRSRPIHLVLPQRRRLRSKSDLVVQTTKLIEADLAMVGPIRATSALRTVLDMAADADTLGVELAIEDCLRRRLFTVGQLEQQAAVRLGKGVAGSAVIRDLVARRGLGATDSGWEVRVARVLTDAGFPEPVRQLLVSTRLGLLHADLGYPGAPTVVFEYDSDRWHSSVRRRHRDVERRNALRAVGCVVIEVTSTLVRDSRSLISLASDAGVCSSAHSTP